MNHHRNWKLGKWGRWGAALLIPLLALILLVFTGVLDGKDGEDQGDHISASVELSADGLGLTGEGELAAGEEQNQDFIQRFFNPELSNGQLQIRYFHLEAEEKSGDAILIHAPNGETMLIDAGIKEVGPKVAEYLQQLGLTHLDYAVATHPHHDHIGGYTTLLRTLEIKQFLTVNVPHTTETYKSVVALLEERQIPVTYLEEGDLLQLGEEVTIEVLNPPKGTGPSTLPAELSTSTINNHSLVMRLTYEDQSILFTGDIYKEREYDLVERLGPKLQADVLDAPHHGDKTSSSKSFITAVQPKYVIMSANLFQSKAVYDRYRKQDIDVFITGIDGHLLITWGQTPTVLKR
ncbi:ComEC/Rec2 family competence protein [Rubeoparvulum massiliense]|uniref:ComEC/Rec2 family competence protein n=1 Tax=Rubeoparvulum massiliense TaxID=1631346 RepID=UPI00065E6F5A|nr:MBL fold metallo-hydrolase [Rubeoparvulum massiliense]